MQVTVENSGGLQRRLTVQVPGGELREKIDARLREIGKTAKMKGFRPGRIPMKVLQQRYGPSVRNEIVSQTMQSKLFEAIEQEHLRLASSPVIERVPEMRGEADLEFSAVVEVLPEIDSIDAGALKIKQPETEVTESDVDDMLKTLREQRQSLDEVERKPSEGDHVLFEFGTADAPEDADPRRLTLVMGSSGLDKVEKALVGLEPGQEGSAKQKFPDNFYDQDLAGSSAKVNLKLVSVKEPNLPEIDEEFIKSFSIESGTMEDLRIEVRANLERELQSARNTFLKTQLLDGLLAAHAGLEVPEGMVRDEAQQLAQREARQAGQEEADPRRVEEHMDQARRRVKSGLLLNEIARQNDIIVDGARVRQAVETVADTYEQSREVVQMYYNNPELLRSVEVSVLEDQVVDWVLENAKVTPETMAFKDLIAEAAKTRQG